jgi:hypothetical protein
MLMNRFIDNIRKLALKEEITKCTYANNSQKAQRKKSTKEYAYPNERMKGSRHDTWKALHPDTSLIGDASDRHVQDKIILLVGEVIRGGIAEHGSKWLRSDTGRYWCKVVNLEPTYIQRKINSGLKPKRPKDMRQ